MASLQVINLTSLIDDAKCYELIRHYRWPDGVRCTACSSAAVIRQGHDDTQRHRQRYRCKDCGARFDDVTETVLAGHHQPLRASVAGYQPCLTEAPSRSKPSQPRLIARRETVSATIGRKISGTVSPLGR